jgi:hypothetical protein
VWVWSVSSPREECTCEQVRVVKDAHVSVDGEGRQGMREPTKENAKKGVASVSDNAMIRTL